MSSHLSSQPGGWDLSPGPFQTWCEQYPLVSPGLPVKVKGNCTRNLAMETGKRTQIRKIFPHKEICITKFWLFWQVSLLIEWFNNFFDHLFNFLFLYSNMYIYCFPHFCLYLNECFWTERILSQGLELDLYWTCCGFHHNSSNHANSLKTKYLSAWCLLKQSV